jgi:hypothetical protein
LQQKGIACHNNLATLGKIIEQYCVGATTAATNTKIVAISIQKTARIIFLPSIFSKLQHIANLTANILKLSEPKSFFDDLMISSGEEIITGDIDTKREINKTFLQAWGNLIREKTRLFEQVVSNIEAPDFIAKGVKLIDEVTHMILSCLSQLHYNKETLLDGLEKSELFNYKESLMQLYQQLALLKSKLDQKYPNISNPFPIGIVIHEISKLVRELLPPT